VKQKIVINFCLLGLSVLSTQAYSVEALNQYKGADLIKFEQESQADYSLPLANLKKSARAWIPIKSKLVQGDITSSLYKFGRGESLEPIYQHYKQQLLSSASVLYECSGRTCGSSNAWANNFFNDYRLYGADSNQTLLVVANEDELNTEFKVLYLNRRGAGDVMLRLDSIISHNSTENADLVFQVSLNDKVAIRRYLDSISEDQSIYVLITSPANLTASKAFQVAQGQIEMLKISLGQELSSKINFINFGNQANPIYGENQLSVLMNDNESANP